MGRLLFEASVNAHKVVVAHPVAIGCAVAAEKYPFAVGSPSQHHVVEPSTRGHHPNVVVIG